MYDSILPFAVVFIARIKNADRSAKESIGALRTIMQAEQTHLDVRTVPSRPSIVSGTRRLFPH